MWSVTLADMPLRHSLICLTMIGLLHRINLDTSMVLLRTALPELESAKGLFASRIMASLVAAPGAFSYGHETCRRSRAQSPGLWPIGCSLQCCFSWVATEMADAEMDELAKQRDCASRQEAYQKTQHVPLRRPASPDEVAAAITFLCTGSLSHHWNDIDSRWRSLLSRRFAGLHGAQW